MSRAVGDWQAGLLSLISFVGLVVPASAAVTPVSQTRTLSFSWESDSGLYFCPPPPPGGCSPIDVNHLEDQGSDEALDFTAFSANLDNRVEMSSSPIGPDGLSVSMSNSGSAGGSISATLNFLEYQISSGNETTSAVLTYVFSVDEATAYHLTGEVTAGWSGAFGGGGGLILLEGPLGEEIAVLFLASNSECMEVDCGNLGPELLDSSGTLLPGTYTIRVEVGGAAYGTVSFAGGSPFGLGNDYHASAQATLSFPAAAQTSSTTTRMLLVVVIVGLGLVMIGGSRGQQTRAGSP